MRTRTVTAIVLALVSASGVCMPQQVRAQGPATFTAVTTALTTESPKGAHAHAHAHAHADPDAHADAHSDAEPAGRKHSLACFGTNRGRHIDHDHRHRRRG